MLSLVFGVSVILYVLDVPIIPSSTQMTPTVTIPTISPITTTIPTTPAVTQNSPPINAIKSLSATVDYQPEGQNESITVSVKLINNTISELTSVCSMNDGKSRMYQSAFISEIQPLVIGKDIKNLNLSRVAGASFTTDAFMQAIDIMKTKI